MVMCMKVSSRTILNMVMVFTTIKMVINILGNLRMILRQDKGNIYIKMVQRMMESGKIIKKMEKEFLNCQISLNTKEIF